MVYRGKPSAGCEACRRAKKRCTLEVPACLRCVKLRKDCSGYRDTTELQIQDESEAVKRKALKQKVRQTTAATYLLAPPAAQALSGTLTPASTNSDSSSGSDEATEIVMHSSSWSDDGGIETYGYDRNLALVSRSGSVPLGFSMRPLAAEVATTHFFNQFTASGHWNFLRIFRQNDRIDPCLDLAIRACGMAALDNVEYVSIGRDYARTMYIEALGLLNAALRDPERSKTDESLLAVAMLGYYENLVCDSRESIQSWKAHIAGATQLLKIRGPAQFRSLIGRTLFRETRVQIMIHCIWDDLQPPSFLWDWQDELQAQSVEWHIARPADELIEICYEFAKIRARVERRTVRDEEALAKVNEIDRRMVRWSINTMTNSGALWHYTTMDVPDDPNIWNGMVHVYHGNPAPSCWNTFRSMRILVTRSQEWLCRRLPIFTDAERTEQTAHFRQVRRQMTDEICAGTPAALGHAPSPAYNNPAVLVSAYGSIWPLFFAGTCALERLGTTKWDAFRETPSQTTKASAASAQAAWLLGRLEHISSVVGLKWAAGIASALKGDFTLHTDLMPDEIDDSWGLEIGHHDGATPAWLKRMQEARRARGQLPLLVGGGRTVIGDRIS
ncbi:hypothetical protein LTR59_002773 [Friedmanniomyces endolithicus]|nr:hypothetical protein LTR94_008418 [Friedmanniomyces endolithicus]KAK0797827.1 hypothetical protein LTR38_008062 [Friedmanniomyces endolithicus]KAK0809069.1 hypothetical protein LTR59_002773 [Friedmanniomyces endolithicus]